MSGRQAAQVRTPVHVVGGFLGSGKTTLLRSMLADRWSDETAVIINELGDVGLDGLAVFAPDRPVEMVAGGCACCVRRDELVEALTRLIVERDAGERRFRRIVIETSGVADPAPIAFTINSHPMLRHHLQVASVLVTVDGQHGAAQLRDHHESFQQAIVADELVITKGDLVARSEIARLAAQLAEIAPTARVSLVGDGRDLELPPPLTSADRAEIPPLAADRPHLERIESVSIRTPEPLEWERFATWLSMLLHAHGPRVMRTKGTVDLVDDERVLVNSVQHVVHPPEHVPRDGVVLGTQLVFITRGLDAVALRRSFDTIVRNAA